MTDGEVAADGYADGFREVERCYDAAKPGFFRGMWAAVYLDAMNTVHNRRMIDPSFPTATP